jgi:hypothetical protein
VIELSDPKVTLLEPTRVQFEVNYRFTQGQPDQWYMCDILFPGTPNHGVRMMQGWELKTAGVIQDQIMLSQPGATSFEISISESPSKQGPFRKVSNVASGSIK